MELNKQQKLAVEYKSGPLLIIAGAGTGKTKVITERIAYIINQGWAKPSEILALTFTEKAANEMAERVDAILPLGYEEVLISTFHSFADQILRQEAIYAGLDGNYTLMTQSEGYILFRKHLFEFPLKHFRPLGNPTKFISDILSHFSRLQDEDVSPVQYIEFANNLPEGSQEEIEYKEESLELAKTYKMYGEIKVLASKMDFGDLIFTLLKVFREKPNILKKYHERFKYILVDEFQDTNYTQNKVINMIALGAQESLVDSEKRDFANITVVGDDDQAIYKFRGAAISNILQFKSIYPNATSVVLNENYRSSQHILDCAYRLISNNNPYRLEITESIDKKLIASGENKDKGGVRFIHTHSSSDEAEHIGNEILSLTGHREAVNTEFNEQGQASFNSGNEIYKFNDIAVLVRANSHADEIIETFRYMGIPYKLGGSRSLYQRPEIQVLISFLKSVADYSLDVNVYNVINMPIWKLGARDVVEIVKYASKNRITIFEVLEKVAGKRAGGGSSFDSIILPISKTAVDSIIKIVDIYDESFKVLNENSNFGLVLFKFFENSGLKDFYVNDESGKYSFIVDNTRKFFDMIHTFIRNNPGTNLFEYLDYLNYSIEVGETPNVDNQAFDEYDAVNILTIHGSKGLEFPIVFVANMVSDRFPSRDRRDAIPIPGDLIKEVLSGKGEESEHIMEERRLAYVAFTRAKHTLYLTAADFYALGKRKKKVSNFIYEALDQKYIDSIDIPEHKDKEILVHDSKELLNYDQLGIKVPSEFSYTQLHAYEVCPAQYKYEYVLHLPVAPSGALSFGSTIHNTLKNIYEQLKVSKEGLEGFNHVPTVDDAIKVLDKYWISIGYEDKLHETKRKESGVDLLKLYFEKIFNVDENPIFLERSFDFAIDDFRIRGRIDRIDLVEVIDGVKYVEIIDYKTGKEKSKSDAQKEWQLLLYAYIVEETMGLKVKKASYIYVEHGSKVSVPVDLGRKQEVLDHIREIVGKIRKGDFTLPEGHDCKYCSFKDICEETLI